MINLNGNRIGLISEQPSVSIEGVNPLGALKGVMADGKSLSVGKQGKSFSSDRPSNLEFEKGVVIEFDEHTPIGRIMSATGGGPCNSWSINIWSEEDDNVVTDWFRA